MTRLRTIVADDEPLARKFLRSLLENISEVELIAECRNGREVLQATSELSPDLLILDIQMPGVSGFDVVKDIQSDVMPLIIFCTAYERYAIDAFDLHAVDYVLKPVDDERLKRAIARAVQRFQNFQPEESKSPLVGAIDQISKRVVGSDNQELPEPDSDEALAADRKIAVKDQDSTTLVEIDDIDWIDAAGDYMCIHVNDETLIMRSTLKGLMERLDPEKFKRVHRSTVVNLDRITKATPLSKGEYLLDLDCDHRIKVSRNYRQAIKMFLSTR